MWDEVIRRVNLSYILDFAGMDADGSAANPPVAVADNIVNRLVQLEDLLRTMRTNIDDTIGFAQFMPPPEQQPYSVQLLRRFRTMIDEVVSPGPDFSNDMQNS